MAFEELGVKSALGHELVMVTDLDELAMIETMIWSAIRTVENRCETRTVIAPLAPCRVRPGGRRGDR